MEDMNKLKKPTDFELVPFCMSDAQETVDAYVACGRYVEALRLLRCMKEKVAFDMESIADEPPFNYIPAYMYIMGEFISNIDRQSEAIRNKLRSGT